MVMEVVHVLGRSYPTCIIVNNCFSFIRLENGSLEEEKAHSQRLCGHLAW